MSLMADLMRRIDRVARENGAKRVTRVRVTLGALSHLSPEHFREHFEHAARGTSAEGATLEIETRPDPAHPQAQDVVLESVDVEG